MIKKFFAALPLLTLLALLGLYGVNHWASHVLSQPLFTANNHCVNTTFDLPKGASVRSVPNILAKKGCLNAQETSHLSYALRWQMVKTPSVINVKAGEYTLLPADTFLTVLRRLQQGDVVRHSITIVEGTRFRDLRHLLAATETLSAETSELSDADIMQLLGHEGVHPEGWFAPDTYFYIKGDSDLDILQRAFNEQDKRLQELWQSKQAYLPYSTPYEALIMASIIERETGVASERREIAGVFVRRLQRGMKLQTDPTVIYGMGEEYKGRITRADLRKATPYNTYVIQGMPPTPIALPGKAAIHAALNPASGNTLYFVAKGDGSHYFSKSYNEHRAAIRRYQLQRRDDYRSSPAPESAQ